MLAAWCFFAKSKVDLESIFLKIPMKIHIGIFYFCVYSMYAIATLLSLFGNCRE